MLWFESWFYHFCDTRTMSSPSLGFRVLQKWGNFTALANGLTGTKMPCIGDRWLTASTKTNPAPLSGTAACPPTPPAAWDFWLFPPNPGPSQGHLSQPQGNFMQPCGSPGSHVQGPQTSPSPSLWVPITGQTDPRASWPELLSDRRKEGVSHLGFPLKGRHFTKST